jgi:hypothetical protein
MSESNPPGKARMRILSFIYRFISNFVFLAVVYLGLNFIEKYPNRAILASVVLAYATMRAVSGLRSFYFFSRIERLEIEVRKLLSVFEAAGGSAGSRKPMITEVSQLRRDGEIKSYIDLFFLAAVVLFCVAKIVTD